MRVPNLIVAFLISYDCHYHVILLKEPLNHEIALETKTPNVLPDRNGS
jgi:hypothetical protein